MVVTLVDADATAVATACPIDCAVDWATACALPPDFTYRRGSLSAKDNFEGNSM